MIDLLFSGGKGLALVAGLWEKNASKCSFCEGYCLNMPLLVGLKKFLIRENKDDEFFENLFGFL